MAVVYASLIDQSIREFDPGNGLPALFWRQDTAYDDATQLPGLRSQALISGIGLVVVSTPAWPQPPTVPRRAPTGDGSTSIDDAAASTTTVFSSSKTETQYLNAASNLSDLGSTAAARVSIGVDHSPYYLDEVSGTYPNRPARTGPVVWRGPDSPGAGGTTAGGTPNYVANLDEWRKKAT